MTFAELLVDLQNRGALAPSRVKDIKTSLRYLAEALGHKGLEQATVDGACRDPATWTAALETYFQAQTAKGHTISLVTERNTRNNLRVVFRAAEAHGLLPTPLPSRLLARPKRVDFMRQLRATTPYRSTYYRPRSQRYRLNQPQWPQAIQDGWQQYEARCTPRLREKTLRTYVRWLETYLGYIHHIVGRTPVWEDLFDVTQAAAFVRWHAKRHQRSLTVHARQVVILLAAMAVVLEHPARQALADFRNGLKKPADLHAKRSEHWVPLATLDEVADTLLDEGRAPLTNHWQTQHPGAQRAGRFGYGLMLKLLVRVPLRQRNIREMQLGTNLAQDRHTGHWLLDFRGDELKVGNRGMAVNTYHIDLSAHFPELIPLLDEWFTVHRPKLPNAATSRLVFLTQVGTPHSQQSIQVGLSAVVAMRTGQRFYPHLIRTIWATEFLEATQDFTTAATMLGDTIQTVMKTYYDVIHKDHHAKAAAFLAAALKTG